MWASVKGFLGRNKYRLTTSLVVVGSVYYYYRDSIKQAFALYRLVQEMGQVENGDTNCVPTAGFLETLTTADETSSKQFPQIRSHLAELYGAEMDRIQTDLRAGRTDSRESEFRKLFTLCFSRLCTALISVHALLLLARVEVCLISVDSRRSSAVGGADHRELLGSLRVGRASSAKIDQMVRAVLAQELGRVGPTTSVRLGEMDTLLGEVVRRVISQLKAEPGWTELFLGKLAIIEEDETSVVVKQTLDVIESPQFVAVLTFVIARAVSKALVRAAPEGKEKSAFAAALLMPGVRLEPDIATGGQAYVQLFREAPAVEEFCMAIYEIRQDNSEEAHQLGQLLEKLVRAPA